MKVSIDRDGCIGCGLCTETCPEVFKMGSDGFAEVAAEPTPENEAAVREAADGCPGSVISTEE